ncbi:extracellular triacylglycerol lipase precursor [Moniliophthora roreri MCA 2997]|uniref:Carboxylic ester hydrolase n=2 Tax=Moniliophthora roreri TaxID=221103 RepID=V2X9K1_MONRO|nr:extracellular triacylglycerol lipase precursor [Moniliophthora roreri MCA 2997]
MHTSSLKLSIPLLLFASLVYAATVKVGNTTIVGKDITTQGLEFFGGIPFAEPPIGNLRLKPPVLKPFLDTSTYNAKSFGASCLQVPIPGGPDLSNITLSEDCLSINIIRPAGIETNTTLFPIMVYIYGGGFIVNGEPNLNASTIVARSVTRGTPVVYVSFNYRLGPLGFPAGVEAAAKGALNLGLKDQLAALQWIQSNIAAFGGDKEKVTVFGISAGSISISTLFLNSHLEQYARAAILGSGIAGTPFTFNSTRRQADWDNFVAAVPECECTEQDNAFDCLRGDHINSTHLLQAIGVSLAETTEAFPWVPTLDGPDGLFPELPSEMLKKGRYSKIPFIAGNCLDEGTIFTPTTITDERDLRNILIANYTVFPGRTSPNLDDAVSTILKLYPDIPALGSPYNTGNETFGLSTTYERSSAIYNDVAFQFPRRSWTRVFAQAGVKTYGYEFSYPELITPVYGVAHGSDESYVFGFANQPSTFVPSPAAKRFSEQVIDYWVSFATSLDPNDGLGSERLMWPQYTVEDPILLQLNGSNTGPLADTFREEQFEFVDSSAVIFRH